MKPVLAIWSLAAIAALSLWSAPRAQAECDYVRAFYDGASIQPCPIAVDDYLIIDDDAGVGSQTCENESFDDRYRAFRRGSCGGSNVCVFYIQGNNLSGTYRVGSVDAGGCLTLCACTP